MNYTILLWDALHMHLPVCVVTIVADALAPIGRRASKQSWPPPEIIRLRSVLVKFGPLVAKKLSEIGGFQPIQGERLVRMAYNVACWCVVIYRNNYLRKLTFWQVCSFVGLFDFCEYRLNFGPAVATNIVNMGFLRRTHGRTAPQMWHA